MPFAANGEGAVNYFCHIPGESCHTPGESVNELFVCLGRPSRRATERRPSADGAARSRPHSGLHARWDRASLLDARSLNRWDLTVDQAEKDALTLQASNCDDVPITVIEH